VARDDDDDHDDDDNDDYDDADDDTQGNPYLLVRWQSEATILIII